MCTDLVTQNKLNISQADTFNPAFLLQESINNVTIITIISSSIIILLITNISIHDIGTDDRHS